MCKSIIKGLARRNRERHAMLADVEEEQEQDVICCYDITGKELPWHAVRKALELELKYVRDLGVCEKVDEKEAVAKYGITPVDAKWVDTDKAFEEEPMQIRSRMCAREFESDDRPDLYAGTPLLEALKALTPIAANHKETFRSCTSNAKAQRPVLIRLPVEDRMAPMLQRANRRVRELKDASEPLHKGQKRWDRRSEVINEALAEEVR